MRITLLSIAAFVVSLSLTQAAAAGTFTISTFTDPSGLDLTGNFPLAVNQSVVVNTVLGDATFLADDGTYFAGSQTASGSAFANANLQAIMSGLDFGAVTSPDGLIPVVAGNSYRLQLLFRDPGAFPTALGRPLTVTAEGETSASFDAALLQGLGGVVVTYDFVASDAVLNVTVNNVNPIAAENDNNWILNAFSLEQQITTITPEPTAITLAGLAVVGLVMGGRRRRRRS